MHARQTIFKLLSIALPLSMAMPAHGAGLVPRFTTKEEILQTRPFDSAAAQTGPEDEEDDSEALTGDAGKAQVQGAMSEAGQERGAEASSEALTEGQTEALTEALTEGVDFPEAEAVTEGKPPQEILVSDAEGEFSLTIEGSLSDAQEALAAEDADPALHRIFTYLNGAQSICPGYVFPSAVQLMVPEKSLPVLKAALQQQLSQFDGTWSVYVKDLTADTALVINDCSMPSASTLKLFILGAVYEDIASGALERTSDLVALMTDMIRVSSNEAANRLMSILGNGDYAAGAQRINTYIQTQGYSDATRIYNPFQDPSLVLDPDHVNATTAADCGDLLERIYRRTFGTRKVCNEAEEMMLSQETRYKIPKGVGETALVANKTGETDTIENDVALIYTPTGDYVLCVFSTGWSDKKQAQARITQVSAQVYRFFTEPAGESSFLVFPEADILNRWLEENYVLAKDPYAALDTEDS